MRLHLVDFRGGEYRRTVHVVGEPDVVHVKWDRWAALKMVSGNVALFAKGPFDDKPSSHSYPDI